jgi:hypothetical protein
MLFTLGVTLRECGFMTAPTVAAERRPLAILLPMDIYAFDPSAFDALARDVQASLVRVDEDIPAGQLELLLTAAVEDAAARRHELLPAFPMGDAAENGRRTVPNPALLAYRVGQRLPSPDALAAAAWPARVESAPPGPPSSRKGA